LLIEIDRMALSYQLLDLNLVIRPAFLFFGVADNLGFEADVSFSLDNCLLLLNEQPAPVPLFDHLVGTQQERLRDFQTKRLGD
jgi:hypothetical protein